MTMEDIEETPGGARLRLRVCLSGGLHARPAARLSRAAQRFSAEVRISTDRGEADAKSLLDVLSLALAQGTDCVVEARGHDSREAVATVAACLSSEQD